MSFILQDDDSMLFRKNIEDLNAYLDSLKNIITLLDSKMNTIHNSDHYTDMLSEDQQSKFENIKNNISITKSMLNI